MRSAIRRHGFDTRFDRGSDGAEQSDIDSPSPTSLPTTPLQHA